MTNISSATQRVIYLPGGLAPNAAFTRTRLIFSRRKCVAQRSTPGARRRTSRRQLDLLQLGLGKIYAHW